MRFDSATMGINGGVTTEVAGRDISWEWLVLLTVGIKSSGLWKFGRRRAYGLSFMVHAGLIEFLSMVIPGDVGVLIKSAKGLEEAPDIGMNVSMKSP